MHALQVLLGQITSISIIIYFLIGFFVWYFIYGLEKFLNGGSLGRGRWWVFECFWEEMLWFLPGGLARRIDYIREMVKSDSNTSFIDEYSHKDIRKHNLYEKVAEQSLGNGFYFWGVNVIFLFFLWPLFLCAFVCALAVLIVLKRIGG